MESYANLRAVQDKPGDLDNIKKELLKINGFIKVVLHKIEDDKIPASDFKIVRSKFRHYLDNYFFVTEIETMAPLYGDDVSRVKNMRLKILEALEDQKMIDEVEELIEKI